MVRGYKICFSLSFWKTVVLFVYFFALPLSNCVHSDVECGEEAEPCDGITALDRVEQSADISNLLEHWANLALDESTLLAFPILQHGHLEVVNIPEEIWSNCSERFGIELLGIEEPLDKIDEILHNNLIFEFYFGGLTVVV